MGSHRKIDSPFSLHDIIAHRTPFLRGSLSLEYGQRYEKQAWMPSGVSRGVEDSCHGADHILTASLRNELGKHSKAMSSLQGYTTRIAASVFERTRARRLDVAK